MRRQIMFATVAGMLALGVSASPVHVRAAAAGPQFRAEEERDIFSIFNDRNHRRGARVVAKLLAQHEVPAISSPAIGRFEASIEEDQVEYELTFFNLQGVVTQSHIHIAQTDVNGGIMAWLCKTATNPGPATFTGPTCPAAPGGTVTGTITPADILAVGAQGIAAGEFNEFVAALRKGIAYANVHSSTFGGGEIRGQIRIDRW